MPPFVSTKCPNCQKPNRFDLAELKNNSSSVLKKISLFSTASEDEEFTETCKNCGHKFKFTLKGGTDEKEE